MLWIINFKINLEKLLESLELTVEIKNILYIYSILLLVMLNYNIVLTVYNIVVDGGYLHEENDCVVGKIVDWRSCESDYSVRRHVLG